MRKVGFREDTSRHSHWDNFIAIGTGTLATPALAYDDFYPFGQVMGGRSWNGGTADARYTYTEKERLR
jgi:hypothetical protein